MAAGLLGALLVHGHVRSDALARRGSRGLFALMCALVTFAVGLDMLHIVLAPRVPPFVVDAMTLAETAGELVVMTLMLLAVVRTAARRPRGAGHTPAATVGDQLPGPRARKRAGV